MSNDTAREKRFDWPLCYDAENYILARLQSFIERNSFARRLRQRMLNETGTLLQDWIDYLVVPRAEEKRLHEIGFTADPHAETPAQFKALWHPEAMLPQVLVEREATAVRAPDIVAIRCESIADFLAVHSLATEPEGAPLSRFRQALVSEENLTRFKVVERRGYRGFVPTRPGCEVEGLLKASEVWRLRRRHFADDAEGCRQTRALLDHIISLAGRDLACHAVFAEERRYWQSRNRAAQVQKARQDKLGLGWANHDHHTFRCSREHFIDLMRALEKLGFERRERYYAGAQAGWGAQILEQPVEGIVTFCDVDLEPHETEIDFSRQPLPPARKLGTIGLWVGLHGESLLDAGMHHLECRFDYQLLRDQLAGESVNTMKPFSNFPFLKQAFTEGERWPVRRERTERLLQQGLIEEKQFNQFITDGAIGSHLENLQRKGGFKGFNQKAVSAIIEATDPRKQAAQ
jgi:hypothetical protein